MFLFCAGSAFAQKSQNTSKPDTGSSANKKTVFAAENPVQSTYYDALALYYALENYRAYPLFIKNIVKTVKTTSGKNPDSVGRQRNSGPSAGAGDDENVDAWEYETVSVGTYMIIESSSGKTLNDQCDGDTLAAEMGRYKFDTTTADLQEKQGLIKDILDRETGAAAESSDLTAAIAPFQQNAYLFSANTNNFLRLPGGDPFKNAASALNQNISETGEGLPSVTKLAEGLAEFYIQQVNAEISEAFFVRLKDILSKTAEIRILFPSTLACLAKVQVTQYQQSLNAMKAAFETDIKNLLTHVPELGNLTKYQDLINRYPELTTIFVACDMIAQIKDGHTIADVLYTINRADYIQKVNPNDYNAAVKLAALLSWSVTDLRLGAGKPTNLTWVTPAALNPLKNNPDLFRVFMGLFTQRARGIMIGHLDFYQELIRDSAAVLKGRFLVYNVMAATKAISDILASQSAANSSLSARASEYIDIATQVINLADKCLGVLPSSRTRVERQLIQNLQTTYIPIIKEADSVIYSIEQKQYSNAIYLVDTLLVKLFPSAGAAEARNTFLHYGLFLATVAEAQNSADIKAAITAFALPTGSSRIKKQNAFSWGINGYVGFYRASNFKYSNLTLPATEWGITAPLGLALNWALGRDGSSGALSIYGGIIDIGAVFAYKVNNDTSISSSIQLSQLFAPSIGAVYGFPVVAGKYNIPLSLGANFQWGPRLRNVTEKGNSVLPFLTGRFNVFLAVDLPIVNFHVRPFDSK